MSLAYSLLSVFIVSLLSFIGVISLSVNKTRLHACLTYLVSFAAGALLGDVIFHLLPETVETYGFTLSISFALVGGIVLSFLIEKIVHWRHFNAHSSQKLHAFGIMNLFGDMIHNFIDGIVIAASYFVSLPLGIATTLAVVFHEIPQEIGDFAVLIKSKFTTGKALLFNFLVSLTSFLGVFAALLFSFDGLLLYLLPFAAGTFIYIASADLIPELHKEHGLRASVWQFVMLLLGFALMYSLTLLEFVH